MLKLFVALFTIVPLIFVGVGGYLAWSQHHKITTFVPVTATVLSKEVERHTSRDSDGRTSTSYEPVVKYRYQVDGQTYTCDVVTPLDDSGSSRWAHELIGRYQVNEETEAYHNPKEPHEAFLAKQYSFFPYIFVLFPMLFLAVGAGVAVGTGMGRRRSEPWPVSGDWYELDPTTRIAHRRQAALIVACIWHVVGILTWGHYFRVAEPPYGLDAGIFTLIYELIGLAPVGMFIYYFRLGRILRDADLLINTQQLVVGEPITVRVEQEFYTSLQIEELSVGLVCEKTTKTRSGSKTTVSSHACYEDRAPVLPAQQVGPGAPVSGEHEFRVPPNAEPTSPPGYKAYPRYAWRIEVQTKIPGQPDYRAKFPVTVQGPAGA